MTLPIDAHTAFSWQAGCRRRSILVRQLLLAAFLCTAGCSSDGGSGERPYEDRDRWDRQSTTDWQDF
jgi:hypothetical protein